MPIDYNFIELFSTHAGGIMNAQQSSAPGSSTTAEAPLPMYDSRLEQARGIIRRNAAWSFAGGIIPLPIVDIVTVGAVQLKMLNELSRLYDVPFDKNIVTNIISSLLGSLLPAGLAYGAVGHWLRSIVPIGAVLGVVAMPTFASAATWAMGRIFARHFESGGTFFDFDPVKSRQRFKSEFTKAGDEMAGKPATA
jgi:uncharacterized protein (DUF697 family)